MTAQIAIHELPPAMQSEDCGQLDEFLRAHHDQPVILNCALVTRIGGQAAQVLAAHVTFRSKSGHAVQFEAPSDAFVSSLNTMGLGHLLATGTVTT